MGAVYGHPTETLGCSSFLAELTKLSVCPGVLVAEPFPVVQGQGDEPRAPDER